MPKHPRSDLQRLGTNALDRIKGMLPGSIEEVAGMLRSVVDSRFGTKPVGETIGSLLTGNRIERTKAVSDIGRVGGALAEGFGNPILNIGLGAAGAFAPEGSVLGNLGAEAKENIIKGGGIDEILALAGGALGVAGKLRKVSAATKAVKKPKGAIPRERRVTSRRAVGDEAKTILDRDLSPTERRLSRRRSKRTGDFQKKLENPTLSPALQRERALEAFKGSPRGKLGDKKGLNPIEGPSRAKRSEKNIQKTAREARRNIRAAEKFPQTDISNREMLRAAGISDEAAEFLDQIFPANSAVLAEGVDAGALGGMFPGGRGSLPVVQAGRTGSAAEIGQSAQHSRTRRFLGLQEPLIVGGDAGNIVLAPAQEKIIRAHAASKGKKL